MSSEQRNRSGSRASERIIIAEAQQSLQNSEPLTIITASGDRARHLRGSLRRNGIPSYGHTDKDRSGIAVISVRWAAGMRRPEGTIIVDLHDSRKPPSQRQAVQMYGEYAKHVLGSREDAGQDEAEAAPPQRQPGRGSQNGHTTAEQARGDGKPTLRRSVRIQSLP